MSQIVLPFIFYYIPFSLRFNLKLQLVFVAIQILALIQGIFLLFLLYKKRKDYQQIPFILLFCCILSIISYILGDDDNNIFVKGADWFLFDTSLFITFLFLFLLYLNNKQVRFSAKYFFLLIPNLIYFIIELIETKVEEGLLIETIEFVTELVFMCYLAGIFILALRNKQAKWLSVFTLPIFLLFIVARINEISTIIGIEEPLAINHQYYDSAIHLVIAFLFYFMVYRIVFGAEHFIPKVKTSQYKKAALKQSEVIKYQAALEELMKKEKVFRNRNLSLTKVADSLSIPKQYLSELLNVHLKVSFQDYVNTYRVNDFINLMKEPKFRQYTLLATANEVGFNSKSTFNAAFKKIKGVTPTEYKKRSTVKN